MLFRNRVRDTAQSILIAANTLAGAKIFATRIQPIARDEPPLVMVFSPVEKGESLGAAGIPRFRSVLTLVLRPFVTASTDEGCGEQLDRLCDQVVNALLTSPQFLTIPAECGGRAIEEIKFLHVTSEIKLDGDRFVGDAAIQIGLQYVDAYPPQGGVPLVQISVTGDVGNLFSPTGTFTDDAQAGFPNAPITPAPRTAGPDGRAEFSFTIPFQEPQT